MLILYAPVYPNRVIVEKEEKTMQHLINQT